MTGYSRGDVVLVPYPMGDRLSSRKRPAVVVGTGSQGEGAAEVLIAQVTGRLDGPSRPGDHRLADWQKAGILRPSLVRARLATLPAAAIIRRLGALNEDDLRGVETGLREALEL